MRTGLSVCFVLALTTVPAVARPSLAPDIPPPPQYNSAHEQYAAHIDLPPADTFLYRNIHAREDASLLLGNPHAKPVDDAASGPSVTIGAFHAEIGGTGTHAHLAHYTLEGVHVLGGDVSGSIDGRTARVSISLP